MTLRQRSGQAKLLAAMSMMVFVGPGMLRADLDASRPGQLRRNVVERVKKMINTRAVIRTGRLEAKSGEVLTVSENGKNYTVNTDSRTQLRRRFWGKATLDEMQIGDTLNVIGRWADEAQTTIQAKLVRDESIQKRFGVFVGEVKSLTSTGWVMSTVSEKRPDQTVSVSATTKFVNRKMETIGQADILVGHRVKVRGLWDRVNNTVSEVTQVKDYSLPGR